MAIERFTERGRKATALCWFAAALTVGVLGAGVMGEGAESSAPRAAGRADDGAFRWFSVPIDVGGLAKGSCGVPVGCAIDFSKMLAELGVAGAVDERTLRLLRVGGDGKAVERAVQFEAAAMPRAKRRTLLPGTTEKVSYLAEHPAGRTPTGVKVAGRLTWIVRDAPEGTARYRLLFGVRRGGRMIQVPYAPRNLRGFDERGRATPVRLFPVMQIRPLWPVGGRLHVSESGRRVTTYHVGPTREPAAGDPLAERRPYLYPVIGPDRVSLTEVGKPHDPTGSHAHHRSVWIAHANVDGHDFWSRRGGAILHAGFESMADGPLFCRLVHKTRWLAGGRALLAGRRELTVWRAVPDFRLIDVAIELSPAGSKAVTLGRTNFGLLAVRVAQSMTVFDGGGEILSARGDRNEQGAHTKRAAWIDQSGPVGRGKWGGVAILDHPGNPNHPTAWHCRNDGWAGASFNMAESTPIQPGRPLKLRYRLVLHRHSAAKANVARRFEEYRARPTVRIGRAKEQ